MPIRVMVMSPEQCRAARAWLKWSQKNLADRSEVRLSIVRGFESNQRTPNPNNLHAMQSAFEGVGLAMIFGNDGTPLGIGRAK